MTERLSILQTPLDLLTEEEAVKKVGEFVSGNRARQIITSNALMVLAAQKNSDLLKAYQSAGLVIPDSVGVVWAARRRCSAPVLRIPGIDLMLRLCREASLKGWSVFLLGAKPGVAEAASRKLREKIPGLKVAGVKDGYFKDDETVAAAVRESGADLLFAALDLPRQEIWISRHLSKLGVKAAMGVGGSFDVISGELKRAPAWMRAAGLEWFYRACREPFRIPRILRLPEFFLKAVFFSKD